MQFHLAQIRQETQDTKTFVFEPLEADTFSYEAGQFVTLLFDDHGQEVRRSFSLSSAPATDAQPTITVKRVPNGRVSRQLLDHAQVGDLLHFTEPAGRFVLPPDSSLPRDIILIAAGSGITPVFGLLKQLIYTQSQARIALIYSNKSVETTIFYEQLRALENQFSDRLKVIFLWNNAKNLRMARLSNVLLEELLTHHLHYPRQDALFYTCGPDYFMLMVQITLLSMGFDKDAIHKERYTIDTKPPTQKQYAPQPVALWFRGGAYTLEVAAQQTILDAALKAGVNLPYNCRSGQCGACTALCERGRTELDYNEVLTDDELARGYVLTCVAHPLTSDVKIVF
jgi:2Fe-2S type ferredoxin